MVKKCNVHSDLLIRLNNLMILLILSYNNFAF